MNQEQISEKFESLTKDEIELIASGYCDKEGNMESDDWENFAGVIMGEFQRKNIGWIHDLAKGVE
jgi:hypothetical protein